jgi:hypothetical protein
MLLENHCPPRRGFWIVCAIIAFCSAGCRFQQPPSNSNIAPVHGRITVNGKPEAGLQVYFHSSTTRPSMAITDEDGRYVLLFDQQHTGASIGSHIVRITRNLQPLLDPKPELPAKYNQKSEFVVRVKTGENEFDFDLIEDEANDAVKPKDSTLRNAP